MVTSGGSDHMSEGVWGTQVDPSSAMEKEKWKQLEMYFLLLEKCNLRNVSISAGFLLFLSIRL